MHLLCVDRVLIRHRLLIVSMSRDAIPTTRSKQYGSVLNG